MSRSNSKAGENVDKEIDALLQAMNKKDKASNKLINKLAKKKWKEEQTIIKLLLLGAGESGKTTVFKQMQLYHGKEFDLQTRNSYREKIWFNIIEGLATILKAIEKFGIELETEEQRQAETVLTNEYDRLMSNIYSTSAVMTAELADAFNVLWNSSAVQSAFKRRSEYQLLDNFGEYAESMSKFPVWGGEKWIPTDRDILLCRVRTSGVTNIDYVIRDRFLRVIDVGGQRSERRKWMTLFEGVTGLIYVVSMSEYDQTIMEDGETNRLEEAVKLWEQTVNKKEFESAALILFLNKFDLFQRKYLTDEVPIKYEGEFTKGETGVPPPTFEQEEGNANCPKARGWFTDLFLYHIHDEGRRNRVFVHVTTALDQNNMKVVIGACTYKILETSMQSSGLFMPT